MFDVPVTPVAIGPSAGGSAASTRVCESRSSAQGSDPNCAFSFSTCRVLKPYTAKRMFSTRYFTNRDK